METSANAWIRFRFPSSYQGFQLGDVRLQEEVVVKT
ncbi:MAG: hypothetical protein IRZ24_18550 [Thermogemmatispora sp.]|nr:hypothetical protein [Thermogemmatispora sp.]